MRVSETIERRAVTFGGQGREGWLFLPPDPIGLVVFAHGSGSSHLSPRNTRVAEALAGRGIASLVFDLLTEAEALRRESVFDIGLLSGRLVEAIRWARAEPALKRLPVGLFGASTGAAAALRASLAEPVKVVVSRGGRPDLARAALPKVTADTLLIVGEADTEVLRMNRDAALDLRCRHRVAVVPGADHLFEEPGTLERAMRLAAEWFEAAFRRNGA